MGESLSKKPQRMPYWGGLSEGDPLPPTDERDLELKKKYEKIFLELNRQTTSSRILKTKMEDDR